MDIFLNNSQYTLYYIKLHTKTLTEGYKTGQYMVHNLTWSGVHLRSNLLNYFIQKVVTLVLMTETIPKVYDNTMINVLPNPYDGLEETLTHSSSLKLKSWIGENVTYLCAAILIDSERLNSSTSFKPDHIGYLTRTSVGTYYS